MTMVATVSPPSKPDFAVGTPIPANLPHAVSVSLPKWQDNVDYEEGRLTETMETGYPRFFIHRMIQKLSLHLSKKFATPSEKCILLPSAAVASRCRDFIKSQFAKQSPAVTSPPPVRIVHFSIVDPNSRASPSYGSNSPPCSSSSSSVSETLCIYVVLFPAEIFPIAKSYWQHTGDGISSRMAERCLKLLEESGRLEAGSRGDASPDQSAESPIEAFSDSKKTFAKSRYHSRYAAVGSGVNSANLSPTSSGFLPPKPVAVSSSALSEGLSNLSDDQPSSRKPIADAKPEGTRPLLSDDSLSADHSTYVEERYGRNLPIASAAQAKLALRRRIAGTLLSDRPGCAKNPGASNDSAAGETVRAGTGATEDDVYLYPTGMSAIFHAHQVAMIERGIRNPAASPGRLGALGKSVCFGFPYTDTLKILQKWGPGCHFYGNGKDTDLDELEALLEREEAQRKEKEGDDAPPPVLALFCEFPSNPLLRSPDLPRIRRLADKYGFIVVVDETIGNFVNVEVLPYADILVSSLTKVFSGDANVMGGSLVLNPKGPQADTLRKALEAHYEDTYWNEDAVFLERNSRDFVKRVERIDSNTQALTSMLWKEKLGQGEYPGLIKHVFYPKYEVSKANYEKCRRKEPLYPGSHVGHDSEPDAEQQGGGYGGLFSLTFTSLTASEAFYDALACAKGPSLGTNYTLASPYTILAHYTELDWAEEFGVERGLVRVSVGLEDKEELLKMFESSLKAAKEAVSKLSSS
ncbi:PLP-dependent transferase [Violaceomyces palustris]|uniref:PLP-dependent transferase n=1 Tax=Violaceomyces palustris TaxID=1673888 RepID=A0ACD0P1T0_9BASI|nr:PLP-dependent transferase [Violaceomyces palustris]